MYNPYTLSTIVPLSERLSINAKPFWQSLRRWTELICWYFVLMRCSQLVCATLSGATGGMKEETTTHTSRVRSDNLAAQFHDTRQPVVDMSHSYLHFSQLIYISRGKSFRCSYSPWGDHYDTICWHTSMIFSKQLFHDMYHSLSLQTLCVP